MYRQFTFEGDVHASLSCVPLAVRRKLDLAALKISLAGWQALPHDERLALCHMPVDAPGDVGVYQEVLRGFCGRAGVTLGPLPVVDRAAWSAEAAVARARDRLGDAVNETVLRDLGEEERYSVVKLAEPKRTPEKLRALLIELGALG